MFPNQSSHSQRCSFDFPSRKYNEYSTTMGSYTDENVPQSNNLEKLRLLSEQNQLRKDLTAPYLSREKHCLTSKSKISPITIKAWNYCPEELKFADNIHPSKSKIYQSPKKAWNYYSQKTKLTESNLPVKSQNFSSTKKACNASPQKLNLSDNSLSSVSKIYPSTNTAWNVSSQKLKLTERPRNTVSPRKQLQFPRNSYSTTIISSQSQYKSEETNSRHVPLPIILDVPENTPNRKNEIVEIEVFMPIIDAERNEITYPKSKLPIITRHPMKAKGNIKYREHRIKRSKQSNSKKSYRKSKSKKEERSPKRSQSPRQNIPHTVTKSPTLKKKENNSNTNTLTNLQSSTGPNERINSYSPPINVSDGMQNYHKISVANIPSELEPKRASKTSQRRNRDVSCSKTFREKPSNARKNASTEDTKENKVKRWLNLNFRDKNERNQNVRNSLLSVSTVSFEKEIKPYGCGWKPEEISRKNTKSADLIHDDCNETAHRRVKKSRLTYPDKDPKEEIESSREIYSDKNKRNLNGWTSWTNRVVQNSKSEVNNRAKNNQRTETEIKSQIGLYPTKMQRKTRDSILLSKQLLKKSRSEDNGWTRNIPSMKTLSGSFCLKNGWRKDVNIQDEITMKLWIERCKYLQTRDQWPQNDHIQRNG